VLMETRLEKLKPLWTADTLPATHKEEAGVCVCAISIIVCNQAFSVQCFFALQLLKHLHSQLKVSQEFVLVFVVCSLVDATCRGVHARFVRHDQM
jgi:hypothetical protein